VFNKYWRNLLILTIDEGRANWERLVFEPFETDQTAIAAYLRDLFGLTGTNMHMIKALKSLRTKVETFEFSLSSPGQFNEHVLRWTIDGLLASGLLSDEKRAALKDFLSSSVILLEVADVLNMRMAAIDTWEWDIEGLPIEQRRHVTGKHHIYIEEDLLQAIFLQVSYDAPGEFLSEAGSSRILLLLKHLEISKTNSKIAIVHGGEMVSVFQGCLFRLFILRRSLEVFTCKETIF